MGASNGKGAIRGRRRLVAKGLLFVGSASLSWLLLELLLAWLVPDLRPYSAAYVGPPMPLAASSYLPATTPKDRVFHQRNEEYDVELHFNEYGYRGKYPERLEKTPGSRRILIVGDSFTLGWGNPREHTFVQLIADELGADYEVINAGYRGYISPDAYYAYLLEEGLALEPDLVILVLFTGNDILEITDNVWLMRDEHGMPSMLSTTRLYTDYNGDFLFPAGSRHRLVHWSYRVPVLRESRVFVGACQLVDKVLSRRPFYSREYTLFGRLRKSLPIREGWKRFKLTVESLNRLAAERGVRLLFALIGPSGDRRPGMRDIVRASGATLLDLRPYLPPDGYFREGHLNEIGNRAVASRTIEFLRETPSLLPAEGTD